jgi:quercetin dioxygenase-like cupin family protein
VAIREARLFIIAGAIVAAGSLLAGCSSTAAQDEPADALVVSPAPSPPAADVTTINGEAPPGEPTRVDGSETLLDVIDDGLQHLVYRDTRSPGTRSPIHMHPYGGTTCVTSGQMTLYLEGSEPFTAYEGDCYWMPPGLPMTGANTGDSFAVMLDNFAVPPGEPIWWIVEPGLEDIADEFGGGGGHM